MKEKIIELIPQEETNLRAQIKQVSSSKEIMTVLLDFVGPHGKNIWQDKRQWPEWLLAVEKIYIDG